MDPLMSHDKIMSIIGKQERMIALNDVLVILNQEMLSRLEYKKEHKDISESTKDILNAQIVVLDDVKTIIKEKVITLENEIAEVKR